MNASPMLALGGRAPAGRWGMGSLQEIDHVPFVAPLTKLARTAEATAEIPALMDEALAACVTPPSGPDLHRLPAWTRCSWRRTWTPTRRRRSRIPPRCPAADGDAIDRAAELLRRAERPVVMAGTGLYWARAEERAAGALRASSRSRCS